MLMTQSESAPEPAVRIHISVNGEPRDLPPGTSVADLLGLLGLTPNRVAIELNRTLLPRARYPQTTLHNGATLEIVTLVGGG